MKNILIKTFEKDMEKNNLMFNGTVKLLQEVYMVEVDDEHLKEVFDEGGVGRMMLRQPGWLQYYMLKHNELKALIDYVDCIMEEIKSDKWKSLTENSFRELNQTDKNQYVLQDNVYRSLKRVLVVIKEAERNYSAVVEAIKSQGYILAAYVRRDGEIV